MRPSSHPVYIEGALRLDAAGSQPLPGMLVPRCCGYERRNSGWRYPQVFSPYWRLYYNFAPGQQIRSDAGTLELNPAQFILIPENVLFHCETRSGAPPHLYVHFSLLPGLIAMLKAPVAVRAEPAGVEIVKALKREVTKARVPETGHLCLSLLHWIFSRPGTSLTFAKPRPPALNRVMEHIDQHPSADLSNPALARLAGMSLRAFVRSFGGHFGTSPQFHVRETRVREAARRLAGTAESIDEIAGALAFTNRFYFTRVFKNRMGVSPAKFRRELAR